MGVEHYSAPGARVAVDVELVLVARAVLGSVLGADGLRKVRLRINSLGDTASRAAYAKQLRDFCEAHRASLSADSLARLERGSVLRLLDTKDAADKAVLARGPRIDDALSAESRDYRDAVLQSLQHLSVPFDVDPQLVRGLDYYEHTVFEFESLADDALGASQATVLAGGRYDELCRQFGGGMALAAAGWAAGVERLALLAAQPPPASPAPVLCVATTLASDQVWRALAVVRELTARHPQAVVHLLTGTQWGKLTQRASERAARCVVFVGPDEAAAGTLTVRDMRTGTQRSVASPAQVELE